MKLVEPPSCRPTAPTVFVGRNRRGYWVAREQNGIFGGFFVNRAQALKYALFENGHHPETIVELSHEIELNISANPETSHCPPSSANRKEPPLTIEKVETVPATTTSPPTRRSILKR